MKIYIMGSMTFSKEMLKIQKELEKLGHSILLPCDTDEHACDSTLLDDLERNKKHCIENNVLIKCFDYAAKADAVLVLNYKKNGIDGYIGASSLMEIGIAYQHRKKIFLMNDPPKSKDVRWAHEIEVINPVIIYGDLKKII